MRYEMTQTTFGASLIDRFDVQFDTVARASLACGLGPKKIEHTTTSRT